MEIKIIPQIYTEVGTRVISRNQNIKTLENHPEHPSDFIEMCEKAIMTA